MYNVGGFNVQRPVSSQYILVCAGFSGNQAESDDTESTIDSDLLNTHDYY